MQRQSPAYGARAYACRVARVDDRRRNRRRFTIFLHLHSHKQLRQRYAVAKVSADVISQSYAKQFGLPIAIARSANLYGPGDFHWDRLVPGISRELFHGRPPVIRSNGKQMRDYIYVEDGVRALNLMADAMYSGHILPGSIFNFGSPKMHSVLEVVQRLREIANRTDLVPQVLGGAKDEIDAQHINYEHAKSVLGWSPNVNLTEGLMYTYSWYRRWFQQ